MFSDYLYAKASRNKVPLNGTFELSPVCNFACKMCYVRRTPDQIRREGKQLIPWEKWLELAKQCREAGMLYLLLTGGEPFLYPGFRQLYTELHRMGFIISINSNGTMIDEETVQWLKQAAPSRVNITLYGASRETYKNICGHADGYDRTLNAIQMLKEAGIPVVINASMIPENACDLERIVEIGKELNLNTRVSTYMFPPIRREREEADSRFSPDEAADMYMRRIKCQLKPGAFRALLRNSLESTGSRDASEDNWGTDVEYMRCRAGRSSFWINWEGNMTACAMIDFPMVVKPFEESFLDCWIRLTNTVRTVPVLEGCSGCDKKELCRPCVAMICSETGTTDQKAPYMCQMTACIIDKMKMKWEELCHE